MKVTDIKVYKEHDALNGWLYHVTVYTDKNYYVVNFDQKISSVAGGLISIGNVLGELYENKI